MPKETLLDSALNNRRFPQAQFLTELRFSQFLRDRGMAVNREGVRQLVQAGIIAELHDEPKYFHPFQLWPVREFLKILEIRLDFQFSRTGLDIGAMKRGVDLNFSDRVEDIHSFRRGSVLADFSARILPFLLWLEQYYLPVIHASRAGQVRLVNCKGADWQDWKAANSPEYLLDAHGLTLDELIKWRWKVLWDAYCTDPSPELYLLLRSMPFDQRERFRGSIRLAYDLYELAEMVRLFVEETSQRSVVKEWDPRGHPDAAWTERIYGGPPQFGVPEFLRPVIREYGIDPTFRVMWLVEGDTEEGFIRQYSRGLGVARSFEFVSIRNFGGDDTFGKVIPAIDEDLRAGQGEQCFVTLTFDESARTRKRIEQLVQDGIVNFRFSVSNPDFELGNFSVAELVDVASQWAGELKKSIDLERSKLIENVTDRIQRYNEGFFKAINSVLHLNGEEFKLQKGTEWGNRLAHHRIRVRSEEVESGGYADEKLSKVERQCIAVFRGSQPYINYSMSVERIDVCRLEIL